MDVTCSYDTNLSPYVSVTSSIRTEESAGGGGCVSSDKSTAKATFVSARNHVEVPSLFDGVVEVYIYIYIYI